MDIDDDTLPHEQDNPALLMSATLYLMSAYRANPCRRMALMVRRHLALLAAHPEVDAVVRRTSRELIERHWSAQACEARYAFQEAPGEPGALMH